MFVAKKQPEREFVLPLIRMTHVQSFLLYRLDTFHHQAGIRQAYQIWNFNTWFCHSGNRI